MMDIADKKDLQHRLENFANSDSVYYNITRLEAHYLQELINEDWRK